MNIFQRITYNTLKENKTRTLVTIIGIILSLSMFTAVTTSISSVQNYLLELTMLREGNWHGRILGTQEELSSLSTEKEIEQISLLEHLGYVRLTDGINPNKPYLFIGGMDKNADEMLPIHLTKGRMPQNENEILLPEHLSYNGGVTYELNDILDLKIGQRLCDGVDGSVYVLNQDNPYLYTKEELLSQELTEEEIQAQDTEYLAVTFSHTYTVVGFYERPPIEPYTAPGYTALTVSTFASDPVKINNTNITFNEKAIDTDNIYYTAYLRFQKPAEAFPWLEKHYPNAYEYNQDLLRLYGASYESSYDGILYGLGTILILIILFGSVSLIYNAFSISVTERTKQFGLLASLGATRKQLLHSVLFEAFLLCIVGIPLGILAGITGMGITFSLLGSSISRLFFENINLSLHLHVSLGAIVISVLLGLFTVLFSAYLPARKAMRLSPMEAIRQTADIRIHAGNVKTSRWLYRIFGLSGVLASKNFKRSRKKYRATVVSLFVSIVLFISASSFCFYWMRLLNALYSDIGCDISFQCYAEDNTIGNDKLLERLMELDAVDKGAWTISDHVVISIQQKDLSKEYLELITQNSSVTVSKNMEDTINMDARVVFINDDAYTAYLKELELSPAFFFNAKHPFALAKDNIFSYANETDAYKVIDILNKDNASGTLYQVQTPEGYQFSNHYRNEKNEFMYCFSMSDVSKEDTLELPASDCTIETPLTIDAVPNKMPFFLNGNTNHELVLLYPVSTMEAVLGASRTAQLWIEHSTTFCFTAENYIQAAEDISDILQNSDFGYSSIQNYAQDVQEERTLYTIVMVFSYGFIILISLIALTNVFNTISTNIKLRKREFAMLKSIGMTPKAFRVMMCYECLLYGIKSLLYGIPFSIFITYLIYHIISDNLEMPFYIPWYSLVIAIFSVFLIVGCTMIYSMRKIKKENIIEQLKNDTL